MKFPVGNYTFYNDAANCPHKAFRKHIRRDLPREEPSPELLWGCKVHDAFEARFKHNTPLPTEMMSAEPLCALLDPMGPRVEYRLAMEMDGKLCAWDSPRAWFRGKADVVVMNPEGAWLVDWKTGKVREDPFELECQALLQWANHGHTQILGEYYWMKEGKAGLRYTLDPTKAFERVAKLYGEMVGYWQTGDWPKRKNPLCGWCPVTGCENWRPKP